MIAVKTENAFSTTPGMALEKTLSNQTIDTNIIPKHSIIVHKKSFKKQPDKYDMGRITNDIKAMCSQRLTTDEILKYFSNGHSIMLSDMQVDENNSFSFIASSVFAIDVDDTNCVTDLHQVTEQLKDQAAGLFYTFSHGIKGNRYRLLFQLDRVVNDELKMKAIISLVAEQLHDMGLPVDTQAKNPLQIVRGGCKGYEIINLQNKLNVSDLLDQVQRNEHKRANDLYKSFEKNVPIIPFETLKDMCETIGYIPTGSGNGELWKRLVIGIKHYANIGYITQDQGYELFDIISGSEQSQRSWERLKANGQATIGSLIYEAKQKGYKGKYTNFTYEATPVNYPCETIKVDQYIPVSVAKNILQSNQRILVDSPTGSGKTTAFINAFKELQSPSNHFYIFAMPTIALTLQNAAKHGIMAIKGQTTNMFRNVFQYTKQGNRIFIATYDMVPALLDFLQDKYKQIAYTLVVDEIHKFVTDYDVNYRHEAIQNLYIVSKQANNFIGLSGTIDDIYKEDFDKVIQIDNGNPTSPCNEFSIYTYEKKKDALVELVQLIQVWSTKRKLLIFIQSKKKIDQLQQTLRRKGIKVRTISANSKSNSTYKQLVENESIPEDVQVVLTTSVIADGVNIQNDMEWEVIAVCNDFSSLFNYSSIKQISNRLRNKYRRFSLYMQEPKNKDQSFFNIDNAYNWRFKIANNIVKEINNHVFFDPKLFLRSKVEKRYGIHLATENNLDIDTLFLRHAVSKDQERYFSNYRLAFIHAVEKALHLPCSGVLNISEEIKNNRLDLTEIKTILDELEAQAKLDEEAKAEAIAKTFSLEVYNAFIEENEEIIKAFKDATIHRHFNCIERLSKIADYETCKKIVVQVNKDAVIHSFYNHIKNYIEATYLLKIDRPNKTKQVLLQLLNIKESLSNADYKKVTERITQKTKLSKNDIKEVEKMCIIENSRKKKERMKRIAGPISVSYIADKFNITEEKVKNTILKYVSLKNSTVETVIKAALKA